MTTSYGAWPSPLSAGDVAAGGIDLGHLALEDGTAYWLERRPSEDGRGVVLADPGGDGPGDEAGDIDAAGTPVTPADHDVRTLVHEYGGGDFAVDGETLYYARFEDQRLYRVDLAAADPPATAEPVTPAPETDRGLRYADLEPAGDRVYAVRERHEGPGATDEPANELVVVRPDGDGHGRVTVVAEGHDFYSFPRLSPDGDRLAWTTWDHPQMPWDGTELRVADVGPDGTLADARTVLGGPEESVFQPSWGPDGDLFAVSDRTGWWNLYRVPDTGAGAGDDTGEDPAADEHPDPDPLHPAEAEFGTPQWTLGLSTYAHLGDGRIAVVHGRDTDWALGVLDPETGAIADLETGYDAFPHTRLRADGDEVLTVAAGASDPESVVRVQVGDDVAGEDGTDGAGDDALGVGGRVLRRSADVDLAERYVSSPESVTVETPDGERTHAIYYPPHNPDVEAPDDERPPLVTTVHGGPTSQSLPTLDLEVQFFTTRGVGVLDVNYRGSTGYGRAYRDRLRGEWGVVDTADCVAAADHLAGDRADPDRLAIRGGSAGGYAVLSALTVHDAFDAGVSYYGVADLETLAAHTHKFESRYLDGLVGPLPAASERYAERSPVNHADRIAAPLLLLQGSEDAVVPPEQAEVMVDALATNGVPHAYVAFEGERHGFRREDSRRRALELELDFLGQVFDFDPADDLERVDLVGE